MKWKVWASAAMIIISHSKFYMDFGVEMFNKVILTYFTPLSSCGNCWTLFKGSNNKNRLQIYQNDVWHQPGVRRKWYPFRHGAGVTAFWASPRFGHHHSHIPSVLGIAGGGCPKRRSLRLCLNYFRLGRSREYCQSRIYGWIVYMHVRIISSDTVSPGLLRRKKTHRQ